MSGTSSSRRTFLIRLVQGASLAASAGLVWTYVLRNQARATPFALRPPGARDEDAFHAMCIKCGQCVNACPYDTLRLATAWEPRPIGSPYFLPRENPCLMCPDIPCQTACPTGALTGELENIEDARMGLAVIDTENCLSWQGLRCEVCFLSCPVKGRAISVERRPAATGGYARMVPWVHSDHCTGCGVCENRCPTDEASIRVVDARLVQGQMGAHYRRQAAEPGGVMVFDPPSPPVPTDTPADAASVPGLDALNLGDLP
ncbi:ferredoxin-type protein NapG [Thioalkalivibrio sp.]|uniref:ferredoxin-type protein NapG n=1 Tax=Thioalkalivibrio sp. TaxID=2093813 RepID=UPI0035668113